ncbi:MAG: hypothetical protein Tsb005_05550 [Gammaproteobacteria bacterium]
MEALGHYIMRGRREAILIALLCSVLPLLNWLATATLGLVSLRKGAQEGILILLWLCLPLLVKSYFTTEYFVLTSLFLVNVFVYLSALVLRYSRSWVWVIQAATFCGILVIIGAHAVLPNVPQWWIQHLTTELAQAGVLDIRTADPQAVNFETLQALVLLKYAFMVTGIKVISVLVPMLFSLGFARWWQALLFYRGGFRTELSDVRLTRAFSLVLFLVLVGLLVKNALALDILPVMLLPFFLVGNNFIHQAIVKQKKRHTVWLLVGFYSILIISLFFNVTLLANLVIACAVFDSWFNLKNIQPRLKQVFSKSS